MIKSMTGFGSASDDFAGRSITVEIKSVNNRFREIMPRLPKICSPLEGAIKKQVGDRLERGRIDLWVQLSDVELKVKAFKVDFELASSLKKELDQVRELLGLTAPVTLEQLLSLGIMKQSEESPDVEAFKRTLEPLITQALDALVLMREVEGQHLAEDLEKRLSRLTEAKNRVEELSANAPSILLEKLKHRLSELGAGVKVDPGRLAQEIALLADRADITEELVRFGSHLIKFSEIIGDDLAAGRRLDFLLQEMGREVNTMGSKTQDVEVIGIILGMKSELEKLREQVQNIE